VRRTAITALLLAAGALGLATSQLSAATADQPKGAIPRPGFKATLVAIRFHNRTAVLLKSVRLTHAAGIELHLQCTHGGRPCPHTGSGRETVAHLGAGVVMFDHLNFILQDGATFEIAGVSPGLLGRFVSITVHIGPRGIHLSSAKGCLSSLRTVHPCWISSGSVPFAGSPRAGTPAAGYVPLSSQSYNLSVATQGSGAGSVSGSGISCPGTCSVRQSAGTVITLTAAPSTGSAFAGWGGSCSGTSSCSFILGGDSSVTANFVPAHTLAVSSAGTGTGKVTGGGISCPGVCSASVADGSTVTLTASPTAGTFTGWSGGGCSGSGTCTINVTGDTSVTANFDNPQPVSPYNNYGTPAVAHLMCRGNPALATSDPGGNASQTFTVPAGVASLSSAKVRIANAPAVTAHLTLAINGQPVAFASAVASGDTNFSFAPVSVTAGQVATISVSFTAVTTTTLASMTSNTIALYSAGKPGGTFTTTNTCVGDNTGTVTSTATGLRAVVSGLSP
jgi:Divergent InlB B-repeat domain